MIDRLLDPGSLAANPYIQRLQRRTVVVKAGGGALDDPAAMGHFSEDVNLLHAAGVKPIVVHGGGPQITQWLDRLGVATTFTNGHRVTTPEVLEVARMVLVGKLNRELVASINGYGAIAVGLSGEDLGLLTVTQRHPELGLVGDVTEVVTAPIDLLLSADLVPVIATIGVDTEGQAYNVNADLGASAVAAAVGAEKLIYLTDVDGIRAEPSDPATLISEVAIPELDQMISSGNLQGGMRPKAEASIEAVNGGVTSAHILNAGTPHALLTEILTDQGIGTMVTRREDDG